MSAPQPIAVVVLAAGKGTRMKSRTPKVLHPICGRSLLGHAVAAAASVDPQQLVVVVGHEREQVVAHLGDIAPEAVTADQDEIPGTGRAVQCGLEKVPSDAEGTVLVTYGDVPLLRQDTLQALVRMHEEGRHAVTVLTAQLEDPTGYGRILRDGDDVLGIVEHKDATEEQRGISEINSGIYAFDASVLRGALARIGSDNAQGELYLTDVLSIARGDGGPVRALVIDDPLEVEGANDRVQLAQLGRALNDRVLEKQMRAGVTIVDPATTWIDSDVSIGQDTTILPGVQIHGATTIGADATIGPDTTLSNMEIHDGATLTRVHGSDAVVGQNADVGPFTYLRPGTELGPRGKIGGFCETKNAQIGADAKVPHLSYVGDAEIGEGTNIGAATIFANYDGVAKNRSVVGSYVSVGTNNNLVAPVTIGDGATTGAGTTVREDVPPGALAVNDVSQRTLEGWTLRKRAGTASAEAARAALDAEAARGTDTGAGRADTEQADSAQEEQK